MGQAIIRGLVDASASSIVATVHTAESARALEADLGAGVTAIAVDENPSANVEAVRGAGVVLIAVKPRYVREVLAEIAPALADGVVVVSVAAGVMLDAYHQALPAGTAVVRVMPNTPSLVGKGIAGIVIPEGVTAEQASLARALFESVGEVVEIREDEIDALAAVSGSGPAYFYLFVEQLTAAAIQLGFDEATAARLVESTFSGSAALLDAGERTPAELRQQVTSPGGTTMEAVAVFEAADGIATAKAAFDAAIAKAEVLGKGA